MSSGKQSKPGLKLRFVLPDGSWLGPGKADLLEQIRDTGSIAAAGRAMSMSYKRAWMLVEEMNAHFAQPLVARTRGGSAGGGAELTETGSRVLSLYRRIETLAAESGSDEIAELQGMLSPDMFTEK